MTDLPTILTAAGVSLPTIGGGIAFIWNKVEQRFERIEESLDECRNHRDLAKDRASGLLTVIELLCQEVRRLLSMSGQIESPALSRAKELMDGMKYEFPLDDPLLDALARRLDDRP